jgi:hypothetical protein
MDEKRSSGLPLLLVVLLLLPVLYVAGYLSLLAPQAGSVNWTFSNVAIRRAAGYRWGGQKEETFFRPVHELDRLVRPGYWYYSKADQREIMEIMEMAGG